MKVSVITATFNAAGTLAACLDSVAAQQHADIEQWIIDGASTDGTRAVVDQRGTRVCGVVSEPDRGIYDALNKGLARVTGDVVGFLHADDMFADSQTVASIAQAFHDPDVQVIYGDLTYVDRSDPNRVIRYWQSCPFEAALLTRGWMPPHPTFYARRSVYERLGGFDLRYRVAADYDCMVRLLRAPDTRALYVPRVLVKMRVGGLSNRSLRAIALKSSEDLNIMRRHGLGGLGTLLRKNLSKLDQFLLRPA